MSLARMIRTCYKTSLELKKRLDDALLHQIELMNRIRIQVIHTSAIGFIGTVVLYYIPNSPFPATFCIVTALSAAFHFCIFLIFRRIRSIHVVFVLIVNVVLTPFIAHLSGGIASPFMLLFSSILLTELSFGMKNSTSLAIVIVPYLAVILLEYSGVIAQPAVSGLLIYKSGLATFAIVMANLAFLLSTGLYAKGLIKELRRRLADEYTEKQKYREQIIKMDRMYQLGYLTARVAHDIRSPITVIKGVLQSLQMDYKAGGETHTIIENAVGEVRRMEGLIGNLSGFVRPGHGKKMLFAVNEVVDRVIAVSQMGSQNKSIRFIKGYDARQSTMVFGCPEEIQQVFFNLLKNSIEAIESGPAERGLLMIDLEPSGADIKVSIADNGCGIPPERINEISNDFHSTKKTGWGLGMGIVRDILTSHRTQLEMTSNVGKGTSLNFVLSTKPFEIDF
jgi:signal transduction histidine kinase